MKGHYVHITQGTEDLTLDLEEHCMVKDCFQFKSNAFECWEERRHYFDNMKQIQMQAITSWRLL